MNKKLFTLYWHVLSFLISWGRKRGIRFAVRVVNSPTLSDPLGMYRKITLSLIYRGKMFNVVINSGERPL